MQRILRIEICPFSHIYRRNWVPISVLCFVFNCLSGYPFSSFKDFCHYHTYTHVSVMLLCSSVWVWVCECGCVCLSVSLCVCVIPRASDTFMPIRHMSALCTWQRHARVHGRITGTCSKSTWFQKSPKRLFPWSTEYSEGFLGFRIHCTQSILGDTMIWIDSRGKSLVRNLWKSLWEIRTLVRLWQKFLWKAKNLVR